MYLLSNALAISCFSPCSSILGPIIRVSAFFVEGSGGRFTFGLRVTGTVQLSAYINVRRVCDSRETFTPRFGGVHGLPGLLL